MNATYSRRGRLQTRVHRGAVPGPALGHDRGAEAPGDLGGVVGRAVVDDDHAVGVRHARQQRLQRRSLVAAREHEVTGRVHVSQRRDRRGPPEHDPSGLRSADGYGLRVRAARVGLGPGAGAGRPRDGGAGRPGLGRARAVVPAVARRLGPARRLGHRARRRARRAGLAGTPSTSRPGCRGVACWGRRTSRGLAWMLALALVDGTGGVGDVLDHPYEYLRHRAGDDRPAGDAGRVRQPDPRRRPRPTGPCTSPATRRAR